MLSKSDRQKRVKNWKILIQHFFNLKNKETQHYYRIYSLTIFLCLGYKSYQWCCNTRDGGSYVNRHMTSGPRALKDGVECSRCYTRPSKATALQKNPRAGLIRSRLLAAWLWPGGDPARCTETLLSLGFLAAPKSHMSRKRRADFWKKRKRKRR